MSILSKYSEQTEEDREVFEQFVKKGRLKYAFVFAFVLGRLDAMREQIDSRKIEEEDKQEVLHTCL